MTRRRFNPTHPTAAVLLAVLAVAATWSLARAQDPFAEAAKGAPAPDPFGAPAAAAGKKGKAPGDAPRLEDPVVIQQLRQSNPTTPDQLLQAAEATYRFGRPDETKRYLGLLIAAHPTSADLAPLVPKYTDTLLRLAREPQVAPEGKQVADVIFAAADKVARDPTRILNLVPALVDPDPETRGAAIASLRQAGPYAVGPLLKVLADPARAEQHRGVRDAIVALGRFVEPPLLGALETPDDALRAQVMILLGRLRSEDAVGYLVRPALDPSAPQPLREAATAALIGITGASPTPADAQRLLLRLLAPLQAGKPPYEPDVNGQITLWSWDAATAGPLPREMAAEDAARLLADRLSAELLAIAPSNNTYLQLRLMLGLDWAKTQVGLTQPLARGAGTIHALAVRGGPELVSDVLQDALTQNHIPAALGAIEILGDIAGPTMLVPPAPGQAALARALTHPDQRVRAVAALTIAGQKPSSGFPLASHMREALTRAATSVGARKVLVGHPRLGDAQTLIGRLNELGIEGDVYLTGQALLKGAVDDPDCEMILITDAIDRAPVLETVQALRKDFRTAQIPIGIMARAENFDRLEFLSRDLPMTVVLPHLYSHIPLPEPTPAPAETAATETAAKTPPPAAAAPLPPPTEPTVAPAAEPSYDPLHASIAKLEALKGRNQTTADERLFYAHAALRSLADLAAIPGNIDRFSLLRAEGAATLALRIPNLAEPAAQFLATLGSPKAQTALVEMASLNNLPLAERQIAASAFRAAVRQRGVLLTTSQILQQYDRYNASEQLPPESQQVLSSLLDTIEGAKK